MQQLGGGLFLGQISLSSRSGSAAGAGRGGGKPRTRRLSPPGMRRPLPRSLPPVAPSPPLASSPGRCFLSCGSAVLRRAPQPQPEPSASRGVEESLPNFRAVTRGVEKDPERTLGRGRVGAREAWAERLRRTLSSEGSFSPSPTPPNAPSRNPSRTNFQEMLLLKERSESVSDFSFFKAKKGKLVGALRPQNNNLQAGGDKSSPLTLFQKNEGQISKSLLALPDFPPTEWPKGPLGVYCLLERRELPYSLRSPLPTCQVGSQELTFG